MKYRELGRTRLKVSEMGFGCWAIGGTSYGPTEDGASVEALETAWEHGVNFYDTADTYGHGHSEELLAQFLKAKPRQEIIVATKAGWDFYHGASRKNFDPDYIRFACEQSLKRLRVETIDLYQLHNPSLELIRQGGLIGVLQDLKTQGKIRFIGVSIHRAEEGLEAIRDGRVDTLQLVFNLIDQRMAAQIFTEAREKKIGLIVREPLACGMLTGKYAAGHAFPKTDHRRRWMKEKIALDLEKIKRFQPVLATKRLTLARAALEYVLDHDAVSTVIPGAKTKNQVLENLMAVENPGLRIEQAALLRDIYQRDPIFKEGQLS